MNINEKKKFLGKGNCAKCYLLNSGYVLKKFNNPLDIIDIERFKYFLKYSNSSFLFPFDFVYDDKKFYAYLTYYSLGKKLSDVFTSSNLVDLSSHSIKLEDDIAYVSKGKIVMNDFHSDNILYDGNEFNVIDTDEYSIRDLSSVSEIKLKNYNAYKATITKLFISKLALNRHAIYILDRIDKYRSSDAKISEIILNIKEDMEKYTKDKITTVEDFNSIIKSR